MNLQKHNPLISKALRDAARGKECKRCQRPVSSVGCHYVGPRQHEYGKGARIKGHDFCVAQLCDKCHKYFDLDTQHKDYLKSEEFLHYIMLTFIERYEEGVIKV